MLTTSSIAELKIKFIIRCLNVILTRILDENVNIFIISRIETFFHEYFFFFCSHDEIYVKVESFYGLKNLEQNK